MRLREQMHLDDHSQVRPKSLIRIVLPKLDGFGQDPSVLVVYTVPLYGQSRCVRQDTLNSGVGVRHRRRGDNMIDRAS